MSQPRNATVGPVDGILYVIYEDSSIWVYRPPTRELSRASTATSKGRAGSAARATVARTYLAKTPAAGKRAMAKGLDRFLEAETPEEGPRAFEALAERLEVDADRAGFGSCLL